MSVVPESVKRDYVIADAYMIEFAKDTHENVAVLPATLSDFNNFDPEFTVGFLTAFMAAIGVAEAMPSDDQIEAITTQLTGEVETAMAASRKSFQDSKYFIERAFPNDKTKWAEFGFDLYLKARDNQAKLIEFMKDFYGAAVKYTTQLNAVNFTAVMITEVETVGITLDTKNKAQNNYINGRQGITKERVDKHNAVWQTTVRLCAAGKIIYQADYAQYQKYLLPASDESPALFILKGKVTRASAPTTPGTPAGGTPITLAGVSISVMELPALVTTSDSNGNFGFGNIPAGTYTLNFSKAGYMPQSMPGVIITDIAHPVTLNVVMMQMP